MVAVIADVATEAAPVSVVFVPVMVNVYEVALCRPVTVRGEPVPVAVKEPGLEVAVKDVGVPPVAGALKSTVAAPLLYEREAPTSDAETEVGASGTSAIAVPGLVTNNPFARLKFGILVLYDNSGLVEGIHERVFSFQMYTSLSSEVSFGVGACHVVVEASFTQDGKG